MTYVIFLSIDALWILWEDSGAGKLENLRALPREEEHAVTRSVRNARAAPGQLSH